MKQATFFFYKHFVCINKLGNWLFSEPILYSHQSCDKVLKKLTKQPKHTSKKKKKKKKMTMMMMMMWQQQKYDNEEDGDDEEDDNNDEEDADAVEKEDSTYKEDSNRRSKIQRQTLSYPRRNNWYLERRKAVNFCIRDCLLLRRPSSLARTISMNCGRRGSFANLAGTVRSETGSRMRIQDYFIISSQKLKRGWILTTSQYTVNTCFIF